jgi:hypothetical protein
MLAIECPRAQYCDGLVARTAPRAQFFTVMMAVLVVPISISGWALRAALVSLVGISGVAAERALVFSVCFGLIRCASA